MQLISGLVSNNAAKVRIVLAEKGVAYETVEVPWSKASAWEPKPAVLLAANPRAEVPVLLEQGLTLWDSTVINEYLEEQYPVPAMLPQSAAARAICRLWEDEGDYNQRHIGVLIENVFLGQAGEAAAAASREALSALDAFFGRIDARLKGRNYLCDDYSLADVSVFLTVAFATTLGAAIAQDNLERWYARMLDREAVKAEFEALMAGVAAL